MRNLVTFLVETCKNHMQYNTLVVTHDQTIIALNFLLYKEIELVVKYLCGVSFSKPLLIQNVQNYTSF